MQAKNLFLALLISFFGVCAKDLCTQGHFIVAWDLHNTLVYMDKTKAFFKLGLPLFADLAKHTFDRAEKRTFGNRIQDFYLNTLAQVPTPGKKAITYDLYDPRGNTLPPILRDFMVGEITYQQAMAAIKRWAWENKKTYFNSHKQARRLFKRIVALNFDPQLFVSSLKCMPTIKLLRQCFQATDNEGKRRNFVVIASNWAQECVEPFAIAFKNQIMQYADAGVFSGIEHCAKPCPDFYNKCRSLCSENNVRGIFIDDEEQNRAAAEKLGWIAIAPADAASKLKELGVI